MTRLSVMLLSFLAALAAPQDEPVRIFAAASLTDALAEALSRFETAHPDVRTVPQFGGSSDLARQILAGAPADLFFSADERQLNRLEAEGSIAGGTRADVLSNQLVIVQESSSSVVIEGPRDLEKLERIALADPEAVPAGVYARRYLEERGLWSKIRPEVVPMLDVRGALAAVASGNVGAGFVYRTDAAIEERVRIGYEVPLEKGPDIVYPLVIVEGRARPEVRSLHEFLRSPAASEVFASHGFIVLGATP